MILCITNVFHVFRKIWFRSVQTTCFNSYMSHEVTTLRCFLIISSRKCLIKRQKIEICVILMNRYCIVHKYALYSVLLRMRWIFFFFFQNLALQCALLCRWHVSTSVSTCVMEEVTARSMQSLLPNKLHYVNSRLNIDKSWQYEGRPAVHRPW